MHKTLYDILELSVNASEAEIRTAYRQLAVKYHPDKMNANERRNLRAFSDITRAYAILSDKDKRSAYDQGLINDHGVPIGQNIAVQSRSMTGLFSRESHKASRFKEYGLTRAYQQNFPNDLPFFPSRQAYYLFFNSREDAYSFLSLRHVSAPVHKYVTSASLGLLCSKIKLAQEKPVYHQKRENQPAHILVKTNYSPRMEHLIDTLIKEMFLFELSVESKNSSASLHLARSTHVG